MTPRLVSFGLPQMTHSFTGMTGGGYGITTSPQPPHHHPKELNNLTYVTGDLVAEKEVREMREENGTARLKEE